MSHELEQLRDAALAESAAATDEQTLETTRVRYLGRAGSISAWADRMKSLSKEERPIIGKLLNEARTAVTAAVLTAVVERGRPFAAELKAAQSQAADPGALAPLEAFAATGVPNPNALLRELTSLQPALLQAAGAGAPEGGFLEKRGLCSSPKQAGQNPEQGRVQGISVEHARGGEPEE